MARGPEAANDELRRWSKARRVRKLNTELRATFRPAVVYGDASAMRRDALASRSKKVGSTLMARDVDQLGVTDVVIGMSAIAIGALIGRWWVKRKGKAPTAVQGTSDDNVYVRGTLTLAAR